MASAFELGFSMGFGGTVGSREQEGEKIDLVLILMLYQDLLIFCHSIYYLAEHNIFLLSLQNIYPNKHEAPDSHLE